MLACADMLHFLANVFPGLRAGSLVFCGSMADLIVRHVVSPRIITGCIRWLRDAGSTLK
jgi:hypothetical protein